MIKLPAIFFDRDGTLIEQVCDTSPLNVKYFRSALRVDDVRLVAGAKEIVDAAKKIGYYRIVCSNQGAIEAKLTNSQEVDAVHGKIVELLGDEEAINGFYVCPHKSRGVDRACQCGKPNPGMFLAAAKDFNIDMKRSHAIGDNPRDLQAAFRAGVRGHLIFIDDHTHSTESVTSKLSGLKFQAVRNLSQALDVILGGSVE